ncbi:hypothetical protein DY000_02063942 [Brassica cretica]|uniref:tRNA 4-demethylwyosine synthase (AdoMet-dependent) n=1 Tax=Brassica cretica TaxID=69181 RepID=A0ABQ7ANQ7_BRACR|nr:hypothetical protein DY000_02063942 [Brassica cretica]
MASSSSIHARLALVALLSATTFYCIHKYRRLKRLKTLSLSPSTRRGKIFFISETGTSKSLAQRLHKLLESNGIAFDLVDPTSYEPEDLPKETLAIFVASTWDGGKPPKDGEFLVDWLSESAEDFRVGSLLLSGCRFGVFGVGSRAYGEEFNAVAKEMSRRMVGLGGAEMVPLGEGDVDDGELDRMFQEWCDGGYKIIGSHSGVKICRWTKSQLRGRGGCYKHSFYGIESHRCMETTPSLACANKCVFCWRHHTNPVGKSWQWKMDDPKEIVKGALDLHTKMIKQMKGVPGVTPEKLQEGLTPRHCALSLVGEPIMYPEINALVDELHGKRISTFLVTNAQFPEKILMMKPITQLYVSVDAATKESLKAIDRPLFADFWERFIDSLKALQEKQQRTVYQALSVKSNGEYEVACEHAHSCCVLLGRTDKFKVDGKWFTWIDYEKFHDLVASGEPFTSRDYMAETPSWAVYGAEEGGFDPEQLRYKKERHHHPKPQAVVA